MPLLGPLLAVLLPDTCPACEGPGGVADSRLCAACASLIPGLPRAVPVPEPLAAGFALGSYAGPIGALVRRGKYHPDPGAMAELARRLADVARGRMPRVDAVVHVPVPPLRHLRRGFDQGALLARAVAIALGLPHLPLLRRVRSEEQAGRADRARRTGARGAFRLLPDRPVPAHLLLVDDVVTTGATAAACADELLAGGARSVVLLTAATGRA